jgi:hypothetical protein
MTATASVNASGTETGAVTEATEMKGAIEIEVGTGIATGIRIGTTKTGSETRGIATVTETEIT